MEDHLLGKMEVGVETNAKTPTKKVHSFSPVTGGSPVKYFGISHHPSAMYGDNEDPYPSLSDFHDYEPNLEFDDTELEQAASTGGEDEIKVFDYLESPVSDGTIEENFEEELAAAPFISEPDSITTTPLQDEEDFSDISQHGIVEVVGDDAYGRKIIVVVACKLPSNKGFDHQRFLRYLLYTLDKYVEQDYSLVYFHHGLNSKNKPSLTWLWQAYRAFERKYKKNLKALYLVHPTNFIKLTFQLFKPVISAKFGRKVMYINYLHELNQFIRLDQLTIPQIVLDYDQQLTAKSSHKAVPYPTINNTGSNNKASKTPLDTQQFGVSLMFIKERNNSDIIPPIMRQCVEYLSQPEALATDGLFRRSASTILVKECQAKANRGEVIEFNGDFHLAAVLIKAFLRELEEPLLTFDLFEEIMDFQKLSKDERGPIVKQIILEKLPEDNYAVLKYLVHFLSKVMDRADLNKMTSSNLAVVFGPNLMWSENLKLSLAAIAPINQFTDFILVHQDEIFLI
ncbi:rho GTPase-activating protein 1 isoform X2 [Folsomia candida]|uniref:rho GTPase-activating protein 1 isoform X2 n=1 Tax=Folsomia candida TaxID=158441 RepID=UPI0016053454|nr:rho GTPase-activating protein 1 isoform X2 [Folsomia candida]